MTDYQKIQDEITDFLNEKLSESGQNGFIVGVSGGIDSAATLKLAVKTVGAENVTALITPGASSKEENMSDAEELVNNLGVEYYRIDLQPAVEAIEKQVPHEIDSVSRGNIRARTRMIYEYLEANEEDKMVLGTGNRSELLLGYFTKNGDGAADLLPIADLYKTQVRELAEHLGLDRKFIEKKPTAGLWDGQTDEDELGASYSTIDPILRKLVDEGRTVEETVEELEADPETVKHLEAMYERSHHKREMPASPELR